MEKHREKLDALLLEMDASVKENEKWGGGLYDVSELQTDDMTFESDLMKLPTYAQTFLVTTKRFKLRAAPANWPLQGVSAVYYNLGSEMFLVSVEIEKLHAKGMLLADLLKFLDMPAGTAAFGDILTGHSLTGHS